MSPEVTQDSAPSSGAKRALIIGVNDYDADSISNLGGCVNDAREVQKVLMEKFGVSERNVVLISSPAPEGKPEDLATRTRILQGFEDLIEQSEPGDMVVVYFAGHGSRVRDRDLDESSGRDSTIVPSDALRWSKKDEFVSADVLDITDDEVHVKLLRLAKKGVDNITLIFDSCHSGTMSRGPGDQMTARQAPEDDRPADMLAPVPYTEEEKALLQESRKNASGWTAADGKYTMISGCRDSEFSYEIPGRGDDGEEIKRGALTFFLVQALWEAQPGDTYRDIYERVLPRVTGNNAAQHPQIDGALDREIFGTTEIEPLQFVRVFDVQGSRVVLDGGAAQGLAVGSRWGIYPPGTKKGDEDSRLAEVELTEVGSTRSVSKLLEDPPADAGALKAGLWAAPIAHDYGDQRMRIRLIGEPATAPAAWEELQDRISRRNDRLQWAEEGDRAVRVYLVAPRESVGPDDPVPQLGPTAEPMIAVLEESGDLMMPPKRTGDLEIRQIVDNLVGWAQYRYKLAIENPGSAMAKAVKLDVRVLRKEDGGEVGWEPLVAREGESLPTVESGDRIKLILTNNGPDQVYFGLLDFLVNGQVEVLESGWLQQHTDDQPHLEIPRPSENGFEIFWEGGFPFDPNPYVDSPTEETEYLKLFLTSRETDFAALAQGSATRGRENPLQALLSDSGGQHRGVRRQRVDDWGTIVFPFNMRVPTEIGVLPGTAQTVGGGPDALQVAAEGFGANIRIGGTVDSDGIQRPPVFEDESPAAFLRRVLEEQGVRPMQSLTLGQHGPTAGTRGTGTFRLESTPNDPAWGELLMSSDDAGLVRWHLPEPAIESGSRGSGTSGTRVYRIAPPIVDGASPPQGTRGALGATIGKLFVDRFAVPLLDPVLGAALEKWESMIRPNRLRRFRWDENENDRGPALQSADWEALGAGPCLLLLHGTFSRSEKAFRGLSPDFLRTLGGKYGDRVIALDHMTMAQDPGQNVQWLLDQIPNGMNIELDVLGHSRGGLVGRALADRASQEPDRGVRVRRMICVGSPNAGTQLADGAHVETFLNVFTNLMSVIDPSEVAGPMLQLAQKLASGVVTDLPGIQAMVPGSPFLASSTPSKGTAFYGIASDLASSGSDRFSRRVFERLVKGVLGDEANDLVVPESSVWGDPDTLKFDGKMTLSGEDAVGHLRYFDSEAVRDQIGSWLLRDGGAIVVEPVVDGQVEVPASTGVDATADATPVVMGDATDETVEPTADATAAAAAAAAVARARVGGRDAETASKIDAVPASEVRSVEVGSASADPPTPESVAHLEGPPSLPGGRGPRPPRVPGRDREDPPRLPGRRS